MYFKKQKCLRLVCKKLTIFRESSFSAVRGGDAALPKLLWDDLFRLRLERLFQDIPLPGSEVRAERDGSCEVQVLRRVAAVSQ